MNESSIRRDDPVPNGYAYFNVIDRESEIMPNFAVATFSSAFAQCARDEAYFLAARLNAWKTNRWEYDWKVAKRTLK
jgi:hypothetical protein